MNPEMFREYDIRGVAGKDMTEEDVYDIGQGIGTYMIRHGCRTLTVGRDCRLTSDPYAKRLMEGLVATGCHVTDIGICPTPILYFSISHLGVCGGIMVTASHNPPEYNGFKLCLGSDSIHGGQIQRIRQMIETRDFDPGTGERRQMRVISEYMDHVSNGFNLEKSLRVGIDAGNGTAGVVAVPIMKALGCDVHSLYCDMDGAFPNHEADPTVLKNLKDLISLVRNQGLDLGIGFDGDGDRIGVVDERGSVVYGDKLMILFAREILARRPGATFISEVKCSKLLYDDIEANGGRAIMWKTGHSLIKEKMKQENAALAGEMSGHMFFADRYLGFDDAVYASCRLLEILSKTGKSLSELLSDLPETFTTPEIRIECPDHQKFKVVAKAAEFFKPRYPIIDIDGVRVLHEDGWGLVRASNTQPALVLRFEALTQSRLSEIRREIESVVERYVGER